MKDEEFYKKVQDYFKDYAGSNNLDPDVKISSLFGGAFTYASMVFVNHMMLGGHYLDNQEDKMVVMNALGTVAKILEKYQIKEDESTL